MVTAQLEIYPEDAGDKSFVSTKALAAECTMERQRASREEAEMMLKGELGDLCQPVLHDPGFCSFWSSDAKTDAAQEMVALPMPPPARQRRLVFAEPYDPHTPGHDVSTASSANIRRRQPTALLLPIAPFRTLEDHRRGGQRLARSRFLVDGELPSPTIQHYSGHA